MSQVLLIIDAQQELIDGEQGNPPVYMKDELIANINLVISKAETNHIPIIFVRDLDIAEGTGAGFEVHQDIKLVKDAPFFNKLATNSFYQTGLLEHLKQQKIEHIVIMGCQTEHCIDTAVRTATINGFDVTLVGDGHSTTGNAALSAPQIIAHHNLVLHGHYNVDNFSVVRNTEEDLFSPTHNSYRIVKE